MVVNPCIPCTATAQLLQRYFVLPTPIMHANQHTTWKRQPFGPTSIQASQDTIPALTCALVNKHRILSKLQAQGPIRVQHTGQLNYSMHLPQKAQLKAFKAWIKHGSPVHSKNLSTAGLLLPSFEHSHRDHHHTNIGMPQHVTAGSKRAMLQAIPIDNR